MGPLVNHPVTTLTTSCIASVIVAVNVYLLWATWAG
jgi:hypothetical protein